MLNKEAILRGLRRIARESGVTIDLAVYGGAALALVFDMRVTTREAFYPSSQVPAKVRFGVEEIMERVIARRRARDADKD